MLSWFVREIETEPDGDFEGKALLEPLDDLLGTCDFDGVTLVVK